MLAARDPDLASRSAEKADSEFAQQECNRLVWAWEQISASMAYGPLSEKMPPSDSGLLPWVKKRLLVGWWGVVAVVVASVFFFGAIVGGFK